MSQTRSANLIDLEEGIKIPQVEVQNSQLIPSNSSAMNTESVQRKNLIVEPRDSLDNNPFDYAQKQLSLLNDPFEIVSKEASAYSLNHTQNEVKTENLLVFNEDDTKNSEESVKELLNIPSAKFSRLQSTESNPLSSVSSINSCQSPYYNDSAFESNGSPIVRNYVGKDESSMTLNKAFMTENTISTSFNPENNSSQMNKAFIGSKNSTDLNTAGDQSRKNLEESTPNQNTFKNSSDWRSSSPSDAAVKNKAHKNTDTRKRLLKLSLTKSSAYSPLLRSDSKGSEESGSNLSENTESDHFAAQISAIPVSPKPSEDSCDDLMSIKPNWIDSETDIDSDLEMLRIPILQEMKSPIASPQQDNKTEKTEENISVGENTKIKESCELTELKEKIKSQKIRSDACEDVGALIKSLKNIVLKCKNDEKKAEANSLLETLSSILEDKTEATKPQSMIRQGTFHIDTKEDNASNLNGEISQKSDAGDVVQDKSEPLQSTSLEVSNIVEQIGKLFGNQNVNIVQTNLASSSSSNPTYIVVMGTPVPQNKSESSELYKEYDGSPELSSAQMRRRSQSFSLHDKAGRLSLAKQSTPTHLQNETRTPIKPSQLSRRKSMPMASPGTPFLGNARRSIYGPNRDAQLNTRRSILSVHNENSYQQPHLVSKNVTNLRPDTESLKKLKVKTNDSILKHSGPLKATIPVKKVAPMIITQSISSPIDDTKRNKPVTSTPIVTLALTTGFPSACSTPTADRRNAACSPAKGLVKMKTRYSYISTTPNPKSNLRVSLPAVQGRRRTLSSPKKTDSTKFSAISKPTVKTLKLPENFSKNQISKLAPSIKVSKLQKRETISSDAGKRNKENSYIQGSY